MVTENRIRIYRLKQPLRGFAWQLKIRGRRQAWTVKKDSPCTLPAHEVQPRLSSIGAERDALMAYQKRTLPSSANLDWFVDNPR